MMQPVVFISVCDECRDIMIQKFGDEPIRECPNPNCLVDNDVECIDVTPSKDINC